MGGSVYTILPLPGSLSSILKAASWKGPTIEPRVIQPRSPPLRALSSEYAPAISFHFAMPLAAAEPSSGKYAARSFARASRHLPCFSQRMWRTFTAVPAPVGFFPPPSSSSLPLAAALPFGGIVNRQTAIRASIERWTSMDEFRAAIPAHRRALLASLIASCTEDELEFLRASIESAKTKRDLLGDLPVELAHAILGYLDVSTLCRARLVSRKWAAMIDNAHVWTSAAQRLLLLAPPRECHAVVPSAAGMVARGVARLEALTHRDPIIHELTSVVSSSTILSMTSYVLNGRTHLILSGFDRSVRVYRLPEGTEVGSLEMNRCSAVEADEEIVVTGSFDGTLSVWELAGGAHRQDFRRHAGAVRCLSFRRAEDRLVSGGCDCAIRVWVLSTGQCLRTIVDTHWVLGVRFFLGPSPADGPDALYIASRTEAGLAVDGPDGQRVAVSAMPSTTELRLVRQGRASLALVSSRHGLHVLSLPDLHRLRDFDGHAVDSFDVGSVAIAVAQGTQLQLRAIEDGRVLCSVRLPSPIYAISCAGEHVAAAMQRGHVVLAWGGEAAVRLERARDCVAPAADG
eukprot:m.179629 g.179629  ORF g.179629 m.179629 type:complete len:572 (-) comp9984_c0_seq6:2289-4004(-)